MRDSDDTTLYRSSKMPSKQEIATDSQKVAHCRRRSCLLGFFALLFCSMAAAVTGGIYNKIPKHTGKLRRQDWVNELLAIDAHPEQIRKNLGMSCHVFLNLLKVLENIGGLAPTRYVSSEEQLANFLYMVVNGASNRRAQERFQQSGDTISKYIYSQLQILNSSSECCFDRSFHRILDALNLAELYRRYVRLPDENAPIPPEIEFDTRFFPHFRDALGAIDGSHIAAFLPPKDQKRFRSRKGHISQNVLAACTFDLRFLYILSGWEGSAADSQIFDDARLHDLRVPPGRYYLADADLAQAMH